jgi:DNA invertase Pin-like site-specific DNA recombinase
VAVARRGAEYPRGRDKFAASRKRGMWMGGWTPLGYNVVDRKLVVNEAEAGLVRRIFTRFLELGSVTLLVRELQRVGVNTKQGKPFDKGTLYSSSITGSISARRSIRGQRIRASTTP